MLLSVLYSLGITQALILAYFLFQSRYKLWKGNLFLAQLLFCIACILSLFLARIHYGNAIPAFLFWPVVALPALFGPLLYWYIACLSGAKTATLNKLLHLIPFALLLVLYATEILSSPAAGISHIDDHDVRTKIIIASYVKSASVIGYLIVSIRLVYQDSFNDVLSTDSLKILRWLLVSFLLVAITGSVLGTLFWTGIYVSLWADYLELGFLTLLTYALSIYVLYAHVSPLHPKLRYEKTNLDESTRHQIAAQLNRLMEEQKLFTHEDYSAKYVCKTLGITEQNLSEVLALSFDSNFYHYSNQHRLDCFKTLLRDNPERNLLDLAFDAGFTSKSAFNRSVKSLTGLTPSELKAQIISK